MLSDVSAQREIMSKLPSLMELAHAHAHAVAQQAKTEIFHVS